MGDEKNAMIFIPDISGFTRFVNDTEIQHSQHIIEELLEVLLKSNTLNLEVSEIEGDAILFYRTGDPPEPDRVSDQIRQMFINFHSHIKIIERDTICQCGACRTASRLTLKFFIHFGEIVISKIREHTKLMGKNVILAHRMMKNNVKSDEYLMMTDDFVNLHDNSKMKEEMNWSDIKEGKISYEHIGEVCYYYIELSSLRGQIKPIEPAPEAEKFSDPITFSTKINASMEFVYRIVTDLTQRTNWSEGIKKIEHDENEILRLGSKHICDLSIGLLELETVQNKRDDKKIEYAERATKSYIFPKASTFFILEKSGEETKFTTEFHYKKIFLIGLIIDLIFRKNLEANFRKSAQNLKNLCEAE